MACNGQVLYGRRADSCYACRALADKEAKLRAELNSKTDADKAQKEAEAKVRDRMTCERARMSYVCVVRNRLTRFTLLQARADKKAALNSQWAGK